MTDKLTGKEQVETGGKQVKTGREATQFAKGKSGNPKGRPREKSLTTLLKEALKQIEDKTGKTYDVLLVQRLLEKAISKGDMKAIQMVFERLEGKPKQSIEHSGVDGDPIEYRIELEKVTKEIEDMDNLWHGDDDEAKEEEERVQKTPKNEHVEDTCPSDDGEEDDLFANQPFEGESDEEYKARMAEGEGA